MGLKSKIFILAASLCMLTQVGYSQNLMERFDGIKFIINGNESMAPFNGGMDNAIVQFVDIDGDGKKDLFTFDQDTTLYFYKNVGTAQNAAFKLMSKKYLNLNLRNWFHFVDFDNDNDYDLFGGGEGQSIRFYKNTGSPTNPQYILEVAQLKTNTDTAIITDQGPPSLMDMDNDGDKDLFVGLSSGSIRYFENIGSSSSFSFKYITDEWEDILIISPARPISGNPVIYDNERHGANALKFADVNNDNDYDLLFGDLFSKGVYFIENQGSPSDPNMVIVDSNYPGNQPFASAGYNLVDMVDIDNDNDMDMFISVLYSSQTVNNFVYYKNNGTASNPLFQKQTDDYLNTVDVGANSVSCFSDLTGDGLMDILVGSGDKRVAFFKNTGNQFVPQFTLENDSLSLNYDQSFNFSPALADLDNDGDKDLLLGNFLIGKTQFYRNTGTAQNFNFQFESMANQIGIDSLGQSSAPVFVDIDNDNDFDLFAGDWNGRIHYYENTGTTSNFNFQFRSKFYNGIDVGDESIPRFFDIDGDNDFDLFIGRRDGKISYYRNEGNATTPNFVLQTDNYNNINTGRNSNPEFVDIDNDTDGDLFVGNIKGGFYFYENRDVIGIQTISSNVPDGFLLKQNYPNPFNPTTNIAFDLPKAGFVELSVYDITGKQIQNLLSQHLSPGSYNYDWDAAELSSGVYFYTLKAGDFISTKKMLLLK